jgi:magnesium transporter
MQSENDKPIVLDLLEKGDIERLEEQLENWLPQELAELCSEVSSAEQAIIFNVIDREQAYQTFEELEFSIQVDLLDELRARQVQLILNDMSPDNRTAFLEELEPERLNKLLKLLTQKERRVALSLLGYPEDSIGRLMTPDYVAVNQEWTVKQIINYIRSNGENSETLDVIYIVDEKGYLVDDIRIGDLLLAEDDIPVKEILDGKYISLLVTDDEEVAVKVFKKSNRVALPVTNAGGLLLGIITVDDILELAQEENTEDIQKIGAVEALEEPYMDVGITQMLRKRAPWLIILFIGEMFTASAMSFFENEIDKAVVLALFIPLIVSSGGNSGSQASTLIIRALALGGNYYFGLVENYTKGNYHGTLPWINIRFYWICPCYHLAFFHRYIWPLLDAPCIYNCIRCIWRCTLGNYYGINDAIVIKETRTRPCNLICTVYCYDG